MVRPNPPLSYQWPVTDSTLWASVRELMGGDHGRDLTQVEPSVRGSPGRTRDVLCGEGHWPEAATKMRPGSSSNLRSA